jgi:hypothetical protein
LELLPLSGDHSGKVSGNLIFKALRRRGIETKLIQSSNITMVTKFDDYIYLQVQMVLTMPPAMGRSTAPLASIFEKSAISTCYCCRYSPIRNQMEKDPTPHSQALRTKTSPPRLHP